MPKTRYGARYWLDRLPASRRPAYPRHRGHLTTDVAVVGGGAIGCAVAYVFAAAGVKVALFEQGRIAQEAGRGTGIVVHEPEPLFHVLAKQHGVRDARHIYQVARRGSLEYLSALKRLRIECGLRTQDALHFGADAESIQTLQREYSARKDAGIEAAAVKGAAMTRLAGAPGFGLIEHGAAVVDPYRATLGLARAAAARGAAIFEQSPVVRVRPRRRTVDIRTAGGTIEASKVVLATGYPTEDFKPLRRRFFRRDGYIVLTPELGAAMSREMPRPDLLLRDSASPPHWFRWAGSRVLFAGAEQPSVPERAKARTLVQRAGQLMYELSVMRPAISGVMPDFAWDAAMSATIDGVPYYGPHRNYPHHYFAFSGGTGGLGLSFAAARIILRHYHGASERADEPFSFVRIRE